MDNGSESYRRFLNGDADGLSEIVELYGQKLLLFIVGIVGNLDVAEDLMEDTICELFFKKPTFRQASAFKTYLFSIARHKAMDYLKKASKHATVHLDDVENYVAAAASFEEQLLTSEENRTLYRALGDLHGEYRTVLYLLYFEEMPYEEIGRVMKKSKSQMKNLVHRAKQSLKTALEKEGFVYEK